MWKKIATLAFLLAPLAQAFSAYPVTVSAVQGPWMYGQYLNGTLFYGIGDQEPPTVIDLNPENNPRCRVVFRYRSGMVSAWDDSNNWAGMEGYDGTYAGGRGSSGYNFPGAYLPDYPSPQLMALIGSWADSRGELIGRPFLIRDGMELPIPNRLPNGAVLQLGFNDDIFGDNLGSINIDVYLTGGPCR